MLERSEVPDAVLAERLAQAWGLSVSALRFMPVGYDALAWAYEVTTGAGERFFLKVRRGATGPAAVLLPRYLHECGLHQVLAAISTVDGEPWHRVDGHQLVLYPFVEGVDGYARKLTDDQLTEYGAVLGALHAVRLPEALAAHVPEETFGCPRSPELRSLDSLVRRGGFDNRWQRELAGFWLDRADEIASVAARAEQLGALARAQRLPHVLCHADIHPGNLLIDGDDRLFVVDWDAPIMAPRERDLMFVRDAIIGGARTGDREQALILGGYGSVEVNWPALAYYRYEWVVQDLVEFAAAVFLRPDLGDVTREDSVGWFTHQFSPGGPIEVARGSEPHLAGTVTP
jgi:spectinomycin phosphotransferase